MSIIFRDNVIVTNGNCNESVRLHIVQSQFEDCAEIFKPKVRNFFPETAIKYDGQ